MRAFKFCILTLLRVAAAAALPSDLFEGVEYMPPVPAAGASGDQPELAMNPSTNAILMGFDRDVAVKFDTDHKAKVVGAKRGTLTCQNLAANEHLQEVQIEWEHRPIIIHKTSYEYFPQLNGRRVFMGELAGVGDDGHALTGSATITWNDACDPAIFHLSVVMNNHDDMTHVLKSVPCTDPSIPNCSWIASVKTALRDELEVHHRTRHLRGLTTTNNSTAAVAQKQKLDNGAVLNVIWFYTPASQRVWGDSKMKSMIAAGVVTANQALRQSKTFLQLKCVGIYPLENYNTNSHMDTLADLNAGRVPGVKEKRDIYKADVVQVVIEDASYCGYGNVLTAPSASFSESAYSTVYSQCFSSYSHIHEIGHGLGALHNREDGGTANYWPFSYGYRYCDAPGSYRSIMSYACAASTRVPYFSNPDVSYMGRPTGTANENNARVIRQSKQFVTNFREGG
jgi:hypothetical protein